MITIRIPNTKYSNKFHNVITSLHLALHKSPFHCLLQRRVEEMRYMMCKPAREGPSAK